MLNQIQYFRQKENLEVAKSGNPNNHTIFRVRAQRVTGLNDRRVGGWGRMREQGRRKVSKSGVFFGGWVENNRSPSDETDLASITCFCFFFFFGGRG